MRVGFFAASPPGARRDRRGNDRVDRARGAARAATAPFRRKVGAIEVMVLSDGTLNVPLSFTLAGNTTSGSRGAACRRTDRLPKGVTPTNVDAGARRTRARA